jgi:signal transduction histidine kinase
MRWINRIILYVLCILPVAWRPVDTVSIVAMISAFSAGCFAGYFNRRIAIVCICVLWAVLSFFFPVFSLFWPLLMFDITLLRVYPAYALPTVCFIFLSFCYSGLEIPLLLFGAALSVILGLYSGKTETLSKENLLIRDTSAETTLALSKKNRELIEAQDYEIRIATLTERGRIAREIHDNVGHMLTRALLQTGALMAVDKAENSGLFELKDTLTQAMNSVRESVHDLRDQSIDLYGIVKACIRDFSGYECNFNYDMASDTPREIQYCFAAVIREAFANVDRHSDATRVRIDLQEHPVFYKLSFVDNGSVNDAGYSSEKGMGLDNMRERATLLGGHFYVSTESGFGLHITIPKERQAES